MAAVRRPVVIGSIGELLVEFVCTQKDGRNLVAAPYVGPFPSGAPGIFIDQAARVAAAFGGRAVFAGAVGDDAFGRVVLDRLVADGVDPGLIRVVPGVPTGSAFVSYNSDGSRDFVFNIAHSAASRLPALEEIEAGFLAAGISVLHISGSMLGDPAMRTVGLALCERLCSEGVAISIDPNIRAELISDAGYIEALQRIMAMATYVLPSDADAEVLYPGQAFADWSGRLLSGAARVVVLKRGDQGCVGRDAGGTVALPAHLVTVVDPTGAGDCFCATLVTLLAAGEPLPDALERANAAGALAVQKLGPMEGNASLAEIDGVKG
ncbi:MAG: sugar kinase [Cypionkella sp.]|uniref:sugar kinase n=1 Tax=Cypionkella sp. TaxID=2811411 RepID=UPI002ABD0EB4|nr:sugar kinase [Cypionkella sp.]MDZ4311641.1 sugar kinase [Cypionkella sp.]